MHAELRRGDTTATVFVLDGSTTVTQAQWQHMGDRVAEIQHDADSDLLSAGIAPTRDAHGRQNEFEWHRESNNRWTARCFDHSDPA